MPHLSKKSKNKYKNFIVKVFCNNNFKILFKKKGYNSLSFNSNYQSQDYTIAYRSNGTVQYGMIKKFIETHSQIYCYLQIVSKKRDLSDDPFINDLLSKYFSINQTRNKCEVIPISQIICKCAIIKSENEIFISQCPDAATHS